MKIDPGHDWVGMLRGMLPGLEAKYGVRRLWIFGSHARGEEGPGSDLDVMVEYNHRNFSLLDFVGLKLELSEKLGIEVDLVDRAALRKEFESDVLPEAVPV